MKKSFYIVVSLSLLLTSSAIGQDLKGLKKAAASKLANPSVAGLSEGEVANGLKEALSNGVEKGVAQLSKQDGFYKDLEIKILMPDKVKNVEDKLRKVGQGKKVDELIESMNRAAEDASNEAKDIFISAIKGMNVKDAMSILKGEDNAATVFLEKSTRQSLFEKFSPIVKASLDKTGATKHWSTVFTSYNKIPMVTKVDPDLVEYATNKAIDGLFVQITKQELAIRKNPAARVSDLLKKVFG
jgi:hypothetical protein